MSLVIVDTGCANLSSVAFAFERLGVAAVISDTPETITKAERVIIPGVGAAPFALRKIKDKNLTPVLKSLTQPVMGICLGMQLLFETLSEGGEAMEGLGMVPGHVGRLDTNGQPAPHMGWNTLNITQENLLLKGISSTDYAYFVHSFAAPVSDVTLASSQYGTAFSAVIGHKNVYGCQFHPERSSRTGAKILTNFLDLTT